MHTISDLVEYSYKAREEKNLFASFGTLSLQIYGNSPLQILVRNHKFQPLMKITLVSETRCRVAVQISCKKYGDSSIDHTASVDLPCETPLRELQKLFSKKDFMQPIVVELSGSEIKKKNLKIMTIREEMNRYLVKVFRKLGMKQAWVCKYFAKALAMEPDTVRVFLYERKNLNKELLNKDVLLETIFNVVQYFLEDDDVDEWIRNEAQTAWEAIESSVKCFVDGCFWELNHL